MELALTWIV